MRLSMKILSAALLGTLLSAAPLSAVPGQAGVNADLLRAIEDGNPAAVESLVKAGADVNAAREDGGTPLLYAAWYGRTMAMKTLLAAGAAPNPKTLLWARTPLMWAARNGQTRAIGMLLAAGANVNAKNEQGFTALMNAALNGQTDAAKQLLDAGAELHAREGSGETATMLAALYGHADTLELLIRSGGDVNTVDTYDRTALMYAAPSGDFEVVELLLKSRADAAAKDYAGHDAVWHLNQNRQMPAAEKEQLADLLRGAGKR
ncbi:MAG: ankyrin repeat domain-containing protein [Pyramidobacter sp.]|nr:ankyrin repeat domain-containing protein [Pyramidobacter sp.]